MAIHAKPFYPGIARIKGWIDMHSRRVGKTFTPLLQWLLHTVSPYSAPDCPAILEVRVLIPQSASVSVVGCSPGDVIVSQGVSQSIRHMFYGIKIRRESWLIHSSDILTFQLLLSISSPV
ncbi:hypothetical protein TNCV_529141 [Trichonephila clavipes]|nr:hypothetical protein TNCV_529141 [Trichonephila clavipes]